MNLTRRSLICLAALLPMALTRNGSAQAAPRMPGELVWTIGYDPKTFDPAKVDDEESETVRYLTAGVLLRFNRLTQKVEPELAQSWKVSPDGKTLTFTIRPGLEFSDGSSLTARDVVWSLRRVLLPATGAPVAEEFVAPAGVTVDAANSETVVVHLPQRVIAIDRVFDEIAIEPANRPSEAHVTSGPFFLADYRRSQFVRLRPNPHYGQRDASGQALPYASGIRLDIQENMEQQIRLLQRGEYDLIDSLPPDYFELLRKRVPGMVRDLGPSLNTEQIWFNQSPTSPLADWEKA